MSHCVLSINGGSSSLKFRLYRMPEEMLLLAGQFDGMNSEQPVFKAKYGSIEVSHAVPSVDFAGAADYLLNFIPDKRLVADLKEVQAVGHRVAHGGEYYQQPVVIDEDVICRIDELSTLAPIHNPVNLRCIRVFRDALPHAAQVAVFDTAFHQTISKPSSRVMVKVIKTDEELMIARETLKLLARATNKQHAVGGDHASA